MSDLVTPRHADDPASKTFTLSSLKELVGVSDNWVAFHEKQAKKIRRYRDYVDGLHDAKLTTKMKKMLRIQEGEEFNLNYCELVVESFAERLEVVRISGEDDKANVWSSELLKAVRFDELQMDVHEAAIRDGETFVFVDYDAEAGGVQFHHEPAYDGTMGMLVKYDRKRRNIEAAVKVWYDDGDKLRINVYRKDSIEKYNESLQPIDGPAVWNVGQLPVIHFKNKARGSRSHGVSHLNHVLPIQDGVNRVMTSMIMTGELTSFQVRWAKGFKPPSEIAPGSWVEIAPDGLTKDAVAELGTMEVGELQPFIQELEYLENRIATITKTPLPNQMGGSVQSGEALKERQTGMIAQVKTAQTKIGNRWEDCIKLAAAVHNTFSAASAPDSMWNAEWKDAEPRNDTEAVDNVMKVRDLVGDREALRLLTKVFGWTEADIERILEEKSQQSVRLFQEVLQSNQRTANVAL